ncbi:MAG TPA: MopE-related protein [Myxococcota bacterium]|nr:MopE-related protein [Myxococcota bacterium]HRY94374.1 MopE-related protein [Myxococcota bacterium]HSA23458.1 MopE-related protein [Myxococcota bacterium]
MTWRISRLLVGACLCVGWLEAGAARAQPGFPEVTGAEADWYDGPSGAFRPLDGGVAGTTFHVDGALGDDLDDGSEGNPVRTIARGLELAGPGDTVLVHAGTYHEQVMPPELGTPASRARPLRLLAEPADGASVVLDGTGVQPALEGNLDVPAGVSLNRDSGLIVEGFRIQNWDGYGLAVVQSSDVLVRGCTFADNGLAAADAVHLVLLSSREARVWGNRFEGGAERGIDDRGTGSWIASNHLTGMQAAGIKVGPAPAGQGSRVEHNQLLDNPATMGAIWVDGAQGVSVERNLVVRGSLQGLRLDSAEDCRVLGNTVVGFFTGLEVSFLSRCRLEGNILVGHTLGLEYLSALSGCSVDWNLLSGNTADVEGGQAGPHDVLADPHFTDPAQDLYELAPGSPAVEAGPEDLPVPDGGGARVDIGAFEQGAGAPPWEHQARGAVADPSPAFEWTFVHGTPAATQLGYRVQLDQAPTFDTPALLDSNWVASAEPRWIVPRAFALAPGRWYVRVQTRDDAGATGPAGDPHLAFEVSAAPSCAGQGGQGCQALDSCQGDWREAADDPRCCVGTCQACPDADGDGYASAACAGPDCDDADQAVHPGATEVCENGLDDDCNQLTDLDDPVCGCVDHDLDGYGLHCEAGADCDDGIASVHPGAAEECNYVDDDCDAQTDEGFDLQDDPANCGECFWECAATQVCDLGQCAASCGGGRTDCSGSCLDTSEDLANCGGCGQVCAREHAGERCSAGQCLLTACEAGYVNADLDELNGCEYACAPSGDEQCDNGLDDNCDGAIDEDCEGGGGGCASGAPPGPRPPANPLALLALLAGLLCLRLARR